METAFTRKIVIPSILLAALFLLFWALIGLFAAII